MEDKSLPIDEYPQGDSKEEMYVLKVEMRTTVDDLIRSKRFKNQKEIAISIDYLPGRLSKHLSDNHKQSPITLLPTKNALNSLKDSDIRGGSPRFIKKTVWHLYKEAQPTFTVFWKKNRLYLFVGLMLVVAPFCFPLFLEPYKLTQKAIDLGAINKNLLHFNLFVSALACLIIPNFRLTVSSYAAVEIKKSISKFSSLWFISWLALVGLYIVLLVISNKRGEASSYLFALKDVFNIASAFPFFCLFLVMYFNNLTQAWWRVVFLIFLVVEWIAVLDQFYGIFKDSTGYGQDIVAYCAGVSMLFFVGRLNSKFIELGSVYSVDIGVMKIPFLFCFYLYALIQIKWSYLDDSLLAIAAFSKVILFLFVALALFSNNHMAAYFGSVRKSGD